MSNTQMYPPKLTVLSFRLYQISEVNPDRIYGER